MEKKTIREKESLGLMSPGIKDPDTKGPEISSGIKNQGMVLQDGMETFTPMTGPMKRSKHTTMDFK